MHFQLTLPHILLLLLLLLTSSFISAVADVINLVLVEQARPKFNAKVPKVR
jgi:hypothetical protein